MLVIRRIRSCQCRKIHHELPDCIVPFKLYESECLEHVVSQSEASSTVAADDATLRRWKDWFQEQSTNLVGALRSVVIRFHQGPVEKSSALSQTAHPDSDTMSGTPRLTGANCPSGREHKFVGTYPFCILVRLGAAVDSFRSILSEVQNR